MREPFWKRSETWGLGLAILTLIVMTIFTLHGWTVLQNARDEVRRTRDLYSKAHEFLEASLDAETRQRGFLLTGKDEYLEPYHNAAAMMRSRLADLVRLNTASPSRSARVTLLSRVAGEKLEEMDATIELRRNRGLAGAVAAVDAGAGKQSMDEMRTIIAEIERSQLAVELARQADVITYRARMPVYIGGGAALLLLLLTGAFVVIRAESTRREDALFHALQSRRDAEAARDLLALTLRSIGDAVITAGVDGRVTMLNPVARQLTGWGDEALGRDVHEVFRIVNEYTREPVESPIQIIRRTGAVAGLANHTMLLRKDGGEAPIDDSGAPIRDSGGQLAGFVLVFRDVTERKQSEEALRISEQRFRTLANAAPALLWIAGADGAVSFFNQQWLSFTGRSEDSLIGSGWWSEVHPDDLTGVRSTYESGIRSLRRFSFELRLRRADGAWRSLLCTSVPHAVPAGEFSGYVTACFDITELKETQHSLEISERRFRSLVDETTALVWQTDTSGSFAAPMPQWEEFTGQKWPAYRGYGSMEALHPSDRERVTAAWTKAMETRQHFTADFRMWHAPTQSWRHVITRGFPLRDSSGAVVEWIGTVTDDTDRRRLEDKVQEAAKLESLGILAGGVAHDFNNLLVSILGNASLLESSLKDPAEREFAREVVDAAQRAAILTQQMLAYSGRGRFIVVPVNLTEEVARLEPLIRSAVPSCVQLSLQLNRQIPQTEIDLAQFQQLLLSLVVNAVEAIQAENGVITVATFSETLTAGISTSVFGDPLEPGPYVVLEVRDTGHGMDGATQSRIFDPFFTTKFTGRGLGLPAVLGIVRGHRGGIQVRSSPGEGSTFRILLPVVPIPAEPDRSFPVVIEPSAAEARDSLPTVLVVDDEETVRIFAAGALRRHGFRVELAEDGSRALDIFRANPYGIAAVLLDLTMPVMSGQDTLDALRAIRPDIPVIASSGHREDDVLPRFAGRVQGFIQKPYSSRELAAMLRSVLNPGT